MPEPLLLLIRRHQPEQRAGRAVIVVADTVVRAIGIAEHMQWRFFRRGALSPLMTHAVGQWASGRGRCLQRAWGK
jgi:hypothetical protein